MCKIFTALCILIVFYNPLLSQPATDIYIADLKIEDGHIEVGSLLNITNRDGYDNQPMFLPDGKRLLYTSIRKDGQADIYQYNSHTKSTIRITQTEESEYSPTVMPDGNHFSTVRVEADSAQRLWKFSLDGGEASLLLEKIKPVGYHAWGSRHMVALFVLGSPNSLYLADIRNGMNEKVSESIGRSLHKIPDRDEISFVLKVSENDWWIKKLELESREIVPLIQTLEGSEDYAWTPDRSILMAQGSKLFKWKSDKDQNWIEVADFKKAGLTGITRIAVNPTGDKIALVSNRVATE